MSRRFSTPFPSCAGLTRASRFSGLVVDKALDRRVKSGDDESREEFKQVFHG